MGSDERREYARRVMAPYAGYTEKTVAPGLFVNFDPEGWAMGVTIERAAELLRPYLLAEGAGVS